MIAAGQLQGAVVRTESGRRLGRLREIHVREGQVISFVCGAGGLLQRFWPTRRGRRVAWDKVVSCAPGAVVVRD